MQALRGIYSGQAGWRRPTAAAAILVYLWFALFVSFVHNHPLANQPVSSSSGSHGKSGQSAMMPGQGAPSGECLACEWEHSAGNSLIFHVDIPKPALKAVSSLVIPQQVPTNQSLPQLYHTRGPPLA